jgi:hypothetical protein
MSRSLSRLKAAAHVPSVLSTPGFPRCCNIPRTAAVFPPYPVDALLAWHRHGHDIIKWRKAMNREHDADDLIELGSVSVETMGSTTGKDDHFAGLVQIEGLSDE